MDTLLTAFVRASASKKKTSFNDAFDWLLTRIDFKSEEEAILPENVEITKDAIREFLTDLGWVNSRLGFERLLKEKSGDNAYRADGKVPNVFHEIRNFLCNGAARRDGLIPIHEYQAAGGLETTSAIIWEHDSWEDDGIHPNDIFAATEKEIALLMEALDPNNEDPAVATYGHRLRMQAGMIAENIDYLTHKHPVKDDNGSFKRKPNGKPIKVPRYEDMTLYYDKAEVSPHFSLVKFQDSVEGMSTRFGVSAFSHQDNVAYTLERRQFYDARAIDKETIAKFPFLEKAIKSSDSMLGILLRCTEHINYYADRNPQHARPLHLPERYFPHATRGYRLLSAGWHPVTIMLERLENMAEAEMEHGNTHTRLILDKSLYPALSPHFPLPHNYAGSLLSGKPEYAPNGP